MRGIPACLLLLAVPARAQVEQAAKAAQAAQDTLIDRGVLGLFCLILLLAVAFLYLRGDRLQGRFMDYAVKQTEVLAEVREEIQRSRETIEWAFGRNQPRTAPREASGLFDRAQAP